MSGAEEWWTVRAARAPPAGESREGPKDCRGRGVWAYNEATHDDTLTLDLFVPIVMKFLRESYHV